jgi:hypothetical protein
LRGPHHTEVYHLKRLTLFCEKPKRYATIPPKNIKMNTRNLIDLNNRAVTSLLQGRHKEAMALLRTAITDCNDSVADRNFSSETGLPNPSVAMPDVPSPSSTTLVSSNEKDDDEHSSSHIEVDQKQDKTSIFSVPLWTADTEESFPRRQDETSIFMYAEALVLVYTDHYKRLLIGVLLYNMALVHHARGIERNASNLLTAALKFYSMAVNVTQCRNDGIIASDYWLLLAIYNNMAQLYLSRANSDKLCQCLGNIQTLLAANRVEQVVDVDAYAFFLTNAMLELRVVAAVAA